MQGIPTPVGVVIFIVGIPGFLDDLGTWSKWIGINFLPTGVGTALVIIGLILMFLNYRKQGKEDLTEGHRFELAKERHKFWFDDFPTMMFFFLMLLLLASFYIVPVIIYLIKN